MIWKPRCDQQVTVRYAKSRAQLFPYHAQCGVVVYAGRGRGPANVLVRLQNGTRVVVPRGNLFEKVAQ